MFPPSSTAYFWATPAAFLKKTTPWLSSTNYHQHFIDGRSRATYDTITVGLVERDKHVLFRSLVVRTEEVLEGLCGFPGVVVRDLGRSVVSDMGLANTV